MLDLRGKFIQQHFNDIAHVVTVVDRPRLQIGRGILQSDLGLRKRQFHPIGQCRPARLENREKLVAEPIRACEIVTPLGSAPFGRLGGTLIRNINFVICLVIICQRIYFQRSVRNIRVAPTFSRYGIDNPLVYHRGLNRNDQNICCSAQIPKHAYRIASKNISNSNRISDFFVCIRIISI